MTIDNFFYPITYKNDSIFQILRVLVLLGIKIVQFFFFYLIIYILCYLQCYELLLILNSNKLYYIIIRFMFHINYIHKMFRLLNV